MSICPLSADVADSSPNPPARAKAPRVRVRVGLEPIVQLTAWLFATFEIDFVCATSDFLVTRRVPDRSLSRLGLGCFRLYTSISRWFR